jgi:acetyl-CoA C-acetyltransferase
VQKFKRDLKLDRARVHMNDGAIAPRHRIGTTGSILIGMRLRSQSGAM